jgi:hypothetical protein
VSKDLKTNVDKQTSNKAEKFEFRPSNKMQIEREKSFTVPVKFKNTSDTEKTSSSGASSDTDT